MSSPVGPSTYASGMVPDDDLIIHTSLRGWFSAAISPTVLLTVGAAAMAGAGPRPLPLVLVATGSVLALIVAADLPRHTRFSRDGITRVCLLRRQHLPWERVVAIERTRPNLTTFVHNITEADREACRVSGGLIARGAGPKRWLLTDNLESRAEHDALAELLHRHDIAAPLRASRPHATAPPTHLYRRRKPH